MGFKGFGSRVLGKARAGALCVLGLTLSWLVWLDAANSYFSSVDPGNAPAILSSSPSIWLALSDKNLASIEGNAQFARDAQVMARLSLSKQPLDPVAIRFLGGAANIRAGQLPSARALYLSERVSRRDRWTQLFIAYGKAARGDWTAMDNFDNLLTVSPGMIEELMPSLLQLTASQDGRAALAASWNRRWFTQFIQQATAATQRPADLAMLLIEVETIPEDLNAEDLGRLSGRLAREGLIEEALAIASFAGFDTDRLDAFTPSEQNTDVRFAPLTWSLANAVEGEAVLNQIEVYLEARPAAQFTAMTRVTRMDPGDYVMVFSTTNVAGPPAQIEWQMYCYSDDQWSMTWRSGLLQSTDGSNELYLSLPPTCPTQRWDMQVQGPDAQRAASLEFAVDLRDE